MSVVCQLVTVGIDSNSVTNKPNLHASVQEKKKTKPKTPLAVWSRPWKKTQSHDCSSASEVAVEPRLRTWQREVFQKRTHRFRLAPRCGRGPFPTFFLLNLTVHPQLKPALLFLWIFAIHFATKQVGANLHGNFLLQNEFEFTGGGGVPSDQPTRFSVLLKILFRAKVSLITPFEHLPRPRGDFACANKLTRKTAPFCLWLIYCPITSASWRAARLHAFV